MKKMLSIYAVFFLIVLSSTTLYGQIAMKAEMSQTHYLQYEPVYIRITMRNMSGHPLVFGEHSGLRGSLRFEITGMNFAGYSRSLRKETPTMKGIILQPGATRVFKYNVSAYYDLRKKDNYQLKAVISHPQLGSDYESNRVGFSVIGGREVWNALVGIPDSVREKNAGVVPTRKYRIVSHNTGRESLYVLLVEDTRKIYAVRRLGRDLGYSLKPQCAIDDLSRLHLLIAASPKVFAYYLFDVTGKLEKKEVRLKTDTTPKLVSNRDMGTVLLTGGRRARPDMDYEEIKSLPYIKLAMEEHAGDITEKRGRTLLDNE